MADASTTAAATQPALSYAERLRRVKQPPPKGGMRKAPHLRAREAQKQRSRQTAQKEPNKIAKAMHAATFDVAGGDVLGWGSVSREDLAKQAREEALARQAAEKARRAEKAAAAAEKRRLAEEKEAKRRAEIARQKEAKRKRKELEKQKRAAKRAPPQKSLFPANKQVQKKVKEAKRKAKKEKQRLKREGPTKAERKAAALQARLHEESMRRRRPCGLVATVIIAALVIVGSILGFHHLAHNHQQFVPQGVRDMLEPYVESTVSFLHEYTAPAARHAQKMSDQAAEEHAKHLERQAAAKGSHGHRDL